MRTAVVTGASSGIGLETARGLVAAGHRVLLLCRDETKAAAAQADIGGSSEVVLGDLASMASVRAAARSIESKLDHLDVLVNNAGVTVRQRSLTVDGFDVMLATNHLGPMLLTAELRPLLEAAGGSARVVNVASEAHKFSKLHLDDLQCSERSYGFLGMRRYGETKLMNILTTRQQAKRYPFACNCVHPGGVATNLGDAPRAMRPLMRLLLLSPADGAATSLSAALDDRWAGVTGRYFVRSKLADQKLKAYAKDDESGSRLWDASCELLGS